MFERERGTDRVGDSRGLGPQAARWVIGAFVGRRAQQVGREPELPLALVALHQLPDLVLQVLEHLDLRVRSRVRVGDDAHEFLEGH